jgi:hypothetical protein
MTVPPARRATLPPAAVRRPDRSSFRGRAIARAQAASAARPTAVAVYVVRGRRPTNSLRTVT